MSSSPAPQSPQLVDSPHAGEQVAQHRDLANSSYVGDARLSLQEAQLLDEYKRLAENLKLLSTSLADLAADPSTSTADALRVLERKTALVNTALKSSVWTIVLQQQMMDVQDGQSHVSKG